MNKDENKDIKNIETPKEEVSNFDNAEKKEPIVSQPEVKPIVKEKKETPKNLSLHRPRRVLHAWLFATFLALIGIGGWASSSIFGRLVVEASANLAASIVPDEALSAAFLSERKAQIDADANFIDRLFVSRGNPAPLLSEIERQAKLSGAEASVTSVTVASYDGLGEETFAGATSNGGDPDSPYALVIVNIEAEGSWKPIASFAKSLEELPYASRVERIRLSVHQDKNGNNIWNFIAEVRAVAR